jgi:hypothetical protein
MDEPAGRGVSQQRIGDCSRSVHESCGLSFPLSKILDQPQPYGLAFLRVKLASHDIVLPHTRYERDAVGRYRRG